MIDLHAHTTISDGTLTPAELVREAKNKNLMAIAITDHDSIEGHEEASLEANKLGIRLIKGIEFDVVYKGRFRLHILGLNIDSENEEFIKIYRRYRKRKAVVVPFVLGELSKIGIDIAIEELIPYQSGEYMDRQCIAKYLVDKGYVSLMKLAWINYLDKIPMLGNDLIPAREAFKAIHLAGGKAFMAHYHLGLGIGDFNEDEQLEILGELKELGLDGMEYYYPTFTEEIQNNCGEYIKRFNFSICGGSDFHGANRANIELGIGEGDFLVPDSVLDQILETTYI